jgi:hypothetical protein
MIRTEEELVFVNQICTISSETSILVGLTSNSKVNRPKDQNQRRHHTENQREGEHQ